MDPTTTPPPPDGDSPLDAAVAAVVAVGEAALADEAAYGRPWALFADWAWRHDLDPIGVERSDVEAWLADARVTETTATIGAVLAAVADVHTAHHRPDPTRGLEAR